jgi:histidyl-tRNA synthetase
MNYETLKGTQDFEPKTAIKVNKIIDTIRNNFELFGFRPFDSPLIEYMDTLTMKYDSDSEIVDEIFKVKDRGDRELGLRYDLTTPLSRFVAANPQLKKPFRRYHIAKVFRDGPLKKGRLREFFQCDSDVVGQEGQEIEAELLDLFSSTYTKLGLNVVLELNNNKILRGALLGSGANEKELSSYILSIDKLKKIKLEGVLKEIKEKNLSDTVARNAIAILGVSTLDELKITLDNDLFKEGILELESLTLLLDSLGVNYRLNFSLSRGLDIYTGNLWEVYDVKNTISSSLGAGGRYDKVIGEYQLGTKKEGVQKKTGAQVEIIPAVGISFGLVPTMVCLEELDKLEDIEGVTKLLIVPLSQDCVSSAQILAKTYRLQGKNTEVYYQYSMKKSFKYCDYLGVQELIILGEKDIETKKYVLKNLKTKEQQELSF